MKSLHSLFLFVYFFLTLPLIVHSVDIKDTKFLSQPAISQQHLAFVYSSDLWLSEREGTNIRRLNPDQGIESNPVFSADSNLIAFNAQYDGNTDVFVLAVEGGIPKPLTVPSATEVSYSPAGSKIAYNLH